MAKSECKELIGKKFGRLTVLYRDINNPKAGIYLVCKCDCGNQTTVRKDHLVKGNTKSCGCYNIEAVKKRNFIDLTGQKFGKLKVIKQDLQRSGNNGKKSRNYWLCQCSCGNPNLISISTEDLRSGHTQSCGCLNSRGELKIALLLKELGINFIQQKTYEDLRSDKGNLLKFDFYLPDYNCCIEYNGIQHYRFDGFYNRTEKDYILRQKYDKMKQNYCVKNNLKLIIITYQEYNIINKEILKERIENESQN